MSRRCELTGKSVLVGHKVSHSNRKTKRRFLPNLLNVTLMSDALGRSFKMRVSANALKSVDHRGGLDAFLLKAHDDELAPKVLEIIERDDPANVVLHQTANFAGKSKAIAWRPAQSFVMDFRARNFAMAPR